MLDRLQKHDLSARWCHRGGRRPPRPGGVVGGPPRTPVALGVHGRWHWLMPPRQPPRWRWRRRLVFRGLTATMWGVGESPDARPSADLHCLVRPTDVLAPSPASPTAGGLAWRLASWPLRWLAAGRRRTRGVDPSVSLRPVRLGQPDLPLPAVPRSRRRRAHARRAVANQPRARGLGRPGRRKGPSAARPAVLAPSGPEEASHQRLSATARRSASLCRSCASIRPGSRLGPGPWGLVVRWSGAGEKRRT